MNLDSIGRAKAESTLRIIHPGTGSIVHNDDGSEMTITMYGEYSEEWKTAFYERTRERIEKARTTGETTMSHKDMEFENFEITCRCTKDWNLTDKDGPVEFSLEKVREIYTIYPWVYRQARMHMENVSNFLDPSTET